MTKKFITAPAMALLLGISSAAHSKEILNFNLPFGNKVKSESLAGHVLVDLSASDKVRHTIGKDFYGADSHGFSKLPPSSFVAPLQLGYVRLGGSLGATYNWLNNTYYNKSVQFAYAPLIDRLQLVKKEYRAEPLFQINLLGLQAEQTPQGNYVLRNSATAQHAANSITFINGKNKLGLKNIVMGNEPFEAEEQHEIHIPSADEYIEKFIDYAIALRAAQEAVSGNPNDIKLWGPELSTGWTNWQTNSPSDCEFDYDQEEDVVCSYGNGDFKQFIPYFLNRLAEAEKDKVRNPKGYKMLDHLTVHFYPLFRSKFSDRNSIIKDAAGLQNVAGMLESVNAWDSLTHVNKFDGASPKNFTPKIIPRFKDWMNQYYPDAKLAVTEFGIDSVEGINYHPIVRPLYLADLVGRAATAGLDNFTNSFLQGGDISNSWAMLDKGKKTRLYYTYGMYTNYFLGEIVDTTDDLGDKVNSYSVKTKTGTNIFLINKEVATHTTEVQFKNGNDVEEITQIKLPAWSMTVLEVPDNRSEQIKVHQYGASEMEIDPNLKM